MELDSSKPMPSKEQDGSKKEKVLILGSGPAGMSAALYAARAELKPLVITGLEFGGQVALTDVIENYPGFPDGVGGLELGELYKKQSEKFGARFEFDVATKVELSKRPFQVSTNSRTYLTETIIIATGATPKHIKVPGETRLTGRGVSYCATCDGWFFKKKRVAVIGGGDSALEEAIFLTRFASSVNIIHRRNLLRAGVLLQRRARGNSKISFTLETIVIEIIGENAVNGLRIKNVKTGEETIISIDGVFIFVGFTPNSALFKGQLKMDEREYLKTNKSMQTDIPGVYVAGEISDPNYRQVVTSAGMGAVAAIEAIRFLQENELQ